MNFGILIRLQREYERGIKALFASIFQNVQGLSAVDTIKYLSMIGRRPEVKQLCSNLAQRMVKAQYRKIPQTLVKNDLRDWCARRDSNARPSESE